MQAVKAVTAVTWQSIKLKLIVFTSPYLQQENAGVNDSWTYNYNRKTIAVIGVSMA
jgi:hypothetical protein